MKPSCLAYQNVFYATKDDVKLFASHGRQLRINISLARKLSCLQYYQLRGKTKLVMVGNLQVKLANFKGIFDDTQSSYADWQ